MQPTDCFCKNAQSSLPLHPESYRIARFLFLLAQLIQRIVNHLNLQGKLVVELRLQLVDVVLVVQNFLDVRVQLVNLVGELLDFQVVRQH